MLETHEKKAVAMAEYKQRARKIYGEFFTQVTVGNLESTLVRF